MGVGDAGHAGIILPRDTRQGVLPAQWLLPVSHNADAENTQGTKWEAGLNRVLRGQRGRSSAVHVLRWLWGKAQRGGQAVPLWKDG